MGGQAKRKVDGEVLAGSSRHHQRAKRHGGDDALTFSDLPSDVYRLFFHHIEFIEDVVCLGLASRHLWTFARDHIHAYYMSLLGRWAGENIVCVGEGVERGDYPPGMFSAEELDTLQQTTTNAYVDDDCIKYTMCNEPITLYHFALPSISDMEKVDLQKESWRIYSHCENRAKQDDPAFLARRSEIAVRYSTYLPRDQPWILRNLTTKEFVRSEAIALKPRYIHGPDIQVLGFGEVVLSRICWSTSSSTGLHHTANISRGVWAGHRFDITTLARHEDDTKGVGWTDVSDEVAREIANIWECEYGADIRDELTYWYQRRPNRGYFDTIPP